MVLGGITLTVDRLSISMSGVSRESIETTNLATTGGRTFIPGNLYDPGSLEVEFHVDNDTPATTMNVNTILTDATTTWVILNPEGGKYDGNGFVTDFNWTYPLEDVASGSFTLKCSGSITATNT